jgi:catechol 2,3-dioxygenase-like lactoylglutathione lyase family enzyme
VRGVRIARAAADLDSVRRFYGDGLGLAEIDRFEDHEGFGGVMFGLPGAEYHLEFTTHPAGGRGEAPNRDDLLVLYFGSPDEVAAIAA